MSSERLEKLESQLKFLCLKIHGVLCETTEDSQDSLMDPEDVYEMDCKEAVMHCKEAIKDMLGMKRNVKIFKESGVGPSSAYQKPLQKLEEEIRNHIKVENQLRLYIDQTQAELDKFQKANDQAQEKAQEEISVLEEERKHLSFILSSKDKELEALKRSVRNALSEYGKEICESLSESPTEELESKVHQFERTQKSLKQEILEKDRELRLLRKEISETKRAFSRKASEKYAPELSTANYFKQKYEEKCMEAIKLQNQLKRSTDRSSKKGSLKSSHSPLQKGSENTERSRRKSPFYLPNSRVKLSQTTKKLNLKFTYKENLDKERSKSSNRSSVPRKPY